MINNGNKKNKLLRSLIIIVILLMEFNTKAQYYPFDSVAVKYEILSIKKESKAHVSSLNNLIKKLKKDSEENTRIILMLKDYKNELRRSKDSKDGYVLTLKNIETGGYFDVVTIKTKNIKGEKIKVGKVYEIKLEKFFKETIVPRIGKVFEVTIDDITIRIVGQSWTGNVYTTSNLRGLKYVGCK